MNAVRLRGWILVALQAVLLAALVLGPQGSLWGVPRPLKLAGTLLRLVGLVTVALGAIELGRAVSVHPEPTERATLKTSGLYRLARHPIYSGVIIFAAGVALTSASLLKAAVFVALIVLLNVKAHFEEQLLAARFPSYGEYALRTPRFIPGMKALRN